MNSDIWILASKIWIWLLSYLHLYLHLKTKFLCFAILTWSLIKVLQKSDRKCVWGDKHGDFCPPKEPVFLLTDQRQLQDMKMFWWLIYLQAQVYQDIQEMYGDLKTQRNFFFSNFFYVVNPMLYVGKNQTVICWCFSASKLAKLNSASDMKPKFLFI